MADRRPCPRPYIATTGAPVGNRFPRRRRAIWTTARLEVAPLTPWVMALFAAVAAGYWMYRRYRLREVGEALVSSAPPRPPHEVAYEALEALERSPLLEQGKVKEYYIRVSDILRTYVERRYGVPALEMATVEVLEGLEDAGLHGGTLMDVRQFLELADLVKFAKHTPDPEACREAIPAARRLVDATQPQPQLVEAAVA